MVNESAATRDEERSCRPRTEPFVGPAVGGARPSPEHGRPARVDGVDHLGVVDPSRYTEVMPRFATPIRADSPRFPSG
jgi:hypothetical protein